MTQQKTTKTKTRTGFVIRTPSEKTAIIEYRITKKHPLYGKMIRLKKHMMVHDEKSVAKVGDEVRITETRPISKRKCWMVSEIIQKA